MKLFGKRTAPHLRSFAKASGRGIVAGSKETLAQLSTGLNRKQAELLKHLEEKELSTLPLTKSEERALRLLRERRQEFIQDRNRLLKKYHPFSVLARVTAKRLRA